MLEKIKNFFRFIKRAWLGGGRGKLGVLFMIVAAFFFVRLFMGTRNIQSFVINTLRLNRYNTELINTQNKLQKMQHHVYLLQHADSSPDYIEEMGLKTLNLGNPEFKELKY